MSKIPSLKEWRTATNGGKLSVRSKQLKALDKALEDYWTMVDSELPTDLKPVREALVRWIEYKGDWRNSQRNASPKRIVEQLYDALNSNSLSKEDRAAFEAQDLWRRQRLALLFAGTKLVKRADYEEQIIGKADTAWQAFKNFVNVAVVKPTKKGAPLLAPVAAGGAVVGIDIAVADMLKDFCDTSSLDEASKILLEVSGVSAAEMITTFSQCLPLLGLATSAVQTFKSTGQAARAAYRASDIGRRNGFILPGGDIAEAFKALHLLLRREAMNQARTAAIDASAFGARLALHSVDAGIGSSVAVTAGSLLLKAINTIRNACRFYKAAKVANEILSNPYNLDAKISVQFGSLAFKEQIEWIKRKHLDPVLRAAAEYVSKSPAILLDAENRALFSVGTRLRHKEYKGKIPVYRFPQPN
jgi:hypothetical protein